jgi:hypothetical protein
MQFFNTNLQIYKKIKKKKLAFVLESDLPLLLFMVIAKHKLIEN